MATARKGVPSLPLCQRCGEQFYRTDADGMCVVEGLCNGCTIYDHYYDYCRKHDIEPLSWGEYKAQPLRALRAAQRILAERTARNLPEANELAADAILRTPTDELQRHDELMQDEDYAREYNRRMAEWDGDRVTDPYDRWYGHHEPKQAG